MFWNAKNGNIRMDDTSMDYVSFGKGSNTLIMLPGLGDGLTTVKGMAVLMAGLYRSFAKDYTVYVFSRRNNLTAGTSTRDMANDQARAMNILGIKKAYILGISQGGMIAQYLAIDHPDLVEQLILAVTSSRPNELMQNIIEKWMILAEQKDYKSLIINTAEKSYSDKYLNKHRFFYPLLGYVGKPKDFSRFLIQAKSCINHNTYSELEKISCPTLVIGGKCDKIVGIAASQEMSQKIEACKLLIYDTLGHGAYEEAKDFCNQVMDFFQKKEEKEAEKDSGMLYVMKG